MQAPEVLPPSVTEMLLATFDMSLDAVDRLWDIVKEISWDLPSPADKNDAKEVIFKQHGHAVGLSM